MQPYTPEILPIQNVDWESLIPLIGRASRSLAFFDGVLQGVANPNLLLAPMTTQEAVLSSRIEGTQATLGDVLKFESGEEPVGERRRQDIHEILNYRRALRKAEKELRAKPFNLNLLKDLHAVLLDSVRGRDKGRGKFRTVQNWIGAPNTPIEAAHYIPPAPEQIMGCLDNWEKYYHADRPDPLVQLGILHAQFEIIHPFLDGNGRLGRMVIPIFLYEKKVLSRPMFYLSEYLEEHRDEYYGNLRKLSQKPTAWTEWVQFFLQALGQQADRNTKKARQILTLYNQLKVQVLELTHSQYAVPLLDCLFAKPVFRISDLEGKNMPSRAMVTTMVMKLTNAKILKVLREGSGRRGSIFGFPELLKITEGRRVI